MSTDAWYLTKLQESGVPESMHEGYLRYLLHGLHPGSFLTAVLENDLQEACARADDVNAPALYRHVAFLTNYAPYSCWGSEALVEAWVMRHRQARQDTDATHAETEARHP